MKILVVEDQVMILRSMARRLTSEGFEVVTAEDLTDALQALVEGVDAVITDLNFPRVKGERADLNGFEVAMEARRQGLPVVICSSSSKSSVLGQAASDTGEVLRDVSWSDGEQDPILLLRELIGRAKNR